MFHKRRIITAPRVAINGAWTPANLGSIVKLWCESPLGLSDGDTVNSFTDLSGNAHHISLDGGTPSYETNELNGKAVVKCLSGEYMSVADHADLDVNTHTLFGVIRTDSSGAWRSVIMKAHPTSWTNGYGIVSTTSGGLTLMYYVGDGAENVSYTTSDGETIILVGTFDQTKLELFVNGRSQGTSARTSAAPNNTHAFQLGNASYNSLSSFGSVGLLSEPLLAGNRRKLEGYLAHKFFGKGALNPLPSTHPYKNVHP